MMMFVLCSAFLMIYGEVQDGAMEHALYCTTYLWNFRDFPDFYTDISNILWKLSLRKEWIILIRNNLCRPNPLLSALDFCNSPIWNIKFDELDFYLVSTGISACKIQVWNRLKIKFIKLNISSHGEFQKSSADKNPTNVLWSSKTEWPRKVGGFELKPYDDIFHHVTLLYLVTKLLWGTYTWKISGFMVP